MANINVTIRVDEDVKKEADELFDDLGMSFTTAINIFLRQAVREGRMPFQVGRTTPAAEQVDYAAVSLGKQ